MSEEQDKLEEEGAASGQDSCPWILEKMFSSPRSPGSQYVYEGLGCSGLFTGGGLFLVLALALSQQKYASRLKSSMASFIAALSVVLCFGCVWTLMSIYTSYKAGWYQATSRNSMDAVGHF